MKQEFSLIKNKDKKKLLNSRTKNLGVTNPNPKDLKQ
jgi:hypothetical protein